MFERIRAWLASPVFEGDEDKTRTAAVINAVLFGILGIILMVALVLTFVGGLSSLVVLFLAFFVVLSLAGQVLLRQGQVRLAGRVLVIGLWVFVTGELYLLGGVTQVISATYFLVTLLAALLGGASSMALVAGLSVLASGVLAFIESRGLLPPSRLGISPFAGWLTLTSTLLLSMLLLYIIARRFDRALTRSRRYAAELDEQRQQLEAAVAERTRALERRTRYMEATTDVARVAASVLEPQALLSQVANLISERFGFYHTGIFLIDASGEWAVLQAASSEGGQQMLARGHRLGVGQTGTVGYVTQQGKPRIALDVGEDAVFFNNPDLPETHSAITLPLRARGEIIGALDVQSRQPAAFTNEDTVVLQALADQVALAISNARLFQQSQERLAAVRQAYGEASREAWAELLRQSQVLGFLSSGRGLVPASEEARPEVKAVARTGETLRSGEMLVLPIKPRDQVLGVVRLRKPAARGDWTDREIALMETLAEQLGVALESARLYQDSQRRAARDRLVGEMTAQMRASLEVDAVLQTAVREFRQALNLDNVEVHMNQNLAAEDQV